MKARAEGPLTPPALDPGRAFLRPRSIAAQSHSAQDDTRTAVPESVRYICLVNEKSRCVGSTTAAYYLDASGLQLLVEIACRARNVHAAGDVSLAVFHAFNHAGGLAALRAIGALGGIHHLLAVCGFCDLGYSVLLKNYSFFPQAAAEQCLHGLEQIVRSKRMGARSARCTCLEPTLLRSGLDCR